jgi:hypothetical protein
MVRWRDASYETQEWSRHSSHEDGSVKQEGRAPDSDLRAAEARRGGEVCPVLLQTAETALPYVDIYIHHGGARPMKGKGIYEGGYVYSTARAGRGQ